MSRFGNVTPVPQFGRAAGRRPNRARRLSKRRPASPLTPVAQLGLACAFDARSPEANAFHSGRHSALDFLVAQAAQQGPRKPFVLCGLARCWTCSAICARHALQLGRPASRRACFIFSSALMQAGSRHRLRTSSQPSPSHHLYPRTRHRPTTL